jgi:hypothetical protein
MGRPRKKSVKMISLRKSLTKTLLVIESFDKNIIFTYEV